MLLELTDKVNRLFSAESSDKRMFLLDDIISYISSYQLSGTSMDNSFRNIITSKIKNYAEEPSLNNRRNVTMLLYEIRVGNQVSNILK